MSELVMLRNISAGYVGNSPLFWANSGYTPWIDDARRFTIEQADRAIASTSGSHHFQKVPVSIVERLAKRTIDVQDLNRELIGDSTDVEPTAV